MKTLGLIGGLSWYSTSVYYKTINQLVNQRLEGSHSAKILLYSIDFEEFKTIQERKAWNELEIMMTEIAQRLEKSGADCIMICSVTPHLIADNMRKNINIPLIHIAEETAKEIVKTSSSKVGLLGTKFTMENSFFKNKLTQAGIETLIPHEEDRDFIHASIFNELTKGEFRDETKQRYLQIIEEMRNHGAEGVIFGCTEISFLIQQPDCSIRIFDTTDIHARAAVDFALAK